MTRIQLLKSDDDTTQLPWLVSWFWLNSNEVEPITCTNCCITTVALLLTLAQSVVAVEIEGAERSDAVLDWWH